MESGLFGAFLESFYMLFSVGDNILYLVVHFEQGGFFKKKLFPVSFFFHLRLRNNPQQVPLIRGPLLPPGYSLLGRRIGGFLAEEEGNHVRIAAAENDG